MFVEISAFLMDALQFCTEISQISVQNYEFCAETSLAAYGAFSIGAEAEGGKSKLEFDLKEKLDDGKDPFFNR